MLRRQGDALVPASPIDREIMRRSWPEGQALFCDAKRRRSVAQNNWLHGIVAAAFENQQSDQWQSPSQLRAYAFCVAGHKDTIEHKIVGPITPQVRVALETFAVSIVGTFLEAGEHVFVRQTKDGIAVDVPRSWAFDKLTHEEACRICDEVAAFLVSDEGPCPGADINGLLAYADLNR